MPEAECGHPRSRKRRQDLCGRDVLQEIAGRYPSDKHHHFAAGLVRLHHPMRFPNVFKAKRLRWFRIIATSGYLSGDGL
jgi:hypothetical protein